MGVEPVVVDPSWERKTKWHKWITEILTDALASRPGLLTDWEMEFARGFNKSVGRHGIHTLVSDKQNTVLKRIEQKLY